MRQGFFHVVLRVSTPGVIAVAILSFLFAWNDYLIANIFLNQQDLMTVPVGIQMFIQQYASEWATLMAASTMAMVPVLIVFMFVQRAIEPCRAATAVHPEEPGGALRPRHPRMASPQAFVDRYAKPSKTWRSPACWTRLR